TSNDPVTPSVIIPCTLHVSGDQFVELTVFLEGPFAVDQMHIALNTGGLLPLSQPYNTAPWNYAGPESVAAIPNADVVDWVLLEFRDTPGTAATATPSSTIGFRAALLLKNGSIVDLDGVSPVMLDYPVSGNLFVVVRHRNHIPVMSATSVPGTGNLYQYDFTGSAASVHGGSAGYSEMTPGMWGMVSGNGLCDGMIDMTDKSAVWNPEAGHAGYHSGDFDLDGQISNKDKTEHWTPNLGKTCQVPE
ncbi:MAG: hypothetical protein ACNA7V_15175, partial [Bacteroidales bacterium]